MMAKHKAVSAAALDWAEFTGSMPDQGVVHPEGQNRTEAIARIKRAFSKEGEAGRLSASSTCGSMERP
jgi:hypothetical protein